MDSTCIIFLKPRLLFISDIDVTAFVEAANTELAKGVATSITFSITIENLADTPIVAASGTYAFKGKLYI